MLIFFINRLRLPFGVKTLVKAIERFFNTLISLAPPFFFHYFCLIRPLLKRKDTSIEVKSKVRAKVKQNTTLNIPRPHRLPSEEAVSGGLSKIIHTSDLVSPPIKLVYRKDEREAKNIPARS